MSGSSRRRFLQIAATTGAAASFGGIDLLQNLPRVSAQEAQLDTKQVALGHGIEPLVQLLEETPRDKLLEEVGQRIRGGTSYQEVIAALLLAGVRNIQPRPSVGFKFHAVLVVNSAHIASLASADEHRWLPIFWALDEFKSSQAADVREGNWTMGPVDEAAVPRPSQARQAFVEAMEAWDVEKADAAAAGVARGLASDDAFELFARYGARDFRSIGHKAIYVANAWRTLDLIGWQHAEPVLRSLAYALLAHSGEANPAQSDHSADRPGRRNAELAKKFPETWLDGKVDDAATRDMLVTLRDASSDEACDKVVALLEQGIAPQSIWNALFVGSGELLVRQPAIVALHSVTTTNAMHYAFQTAASDDTRRMLLLQNTAFVTLFRDAMRSRGNVKEFDITELKPAEGEATGDRFREQILRNISGDPSAASREVFAYLQAGGDAQDLIDAARLMVFFKGDNSHDYKFSSAVLEDYHHVSPGWRDRYLAANVFKLRGSGGRDNPLVARTRAALS
jgi:hypothetical protein